MNFGEGHRISEKMLSMGYFKSTSAEEADIIILNTCIVVGATEKKMLKRISELRHSGKDVIVIGCMAKVYPKKIEMRLPDQMILPPTDYNKFSEIIRCKYGIAGSPIEITNECTTIIPIAQGCLGNCSYCLTKLARGRLISYPTDSLIKRFNDYIDNGTKEILISAQDTACYGYDIGTNLASLLSLMLKKNGDYRIRIGMMTPDHLCSILDDLVKVMKDHRVYKFLHIPVQSGSDKILKSMNRNYTVDNFMDTIRIVRSYFPDISISTDVICGFPGESVEDHMASINLIKRLQANTLNITRFSPRYGTIAATMKQINGRISNDRSRELTEIKNMVELNVNKDMIGKIYRAMSTEHIKDGTILRTDNYRPVVIKNYVDTGIFFNIKITGARSTYLIGHII